MSEAKLNVDDTKAFLDEVDKETKKDYQTCSVIDSFDHVFECYRLGSQAIHYYRYGMKKDCSSRYEDLKLCLRTKTKSNEVADAMLRERKAFKEASRMAGRNSEEIWEAKR